MEPSERCPKCWGDGVPEPYWHAQRQGAIPNSKQELLDAIKGQGCSFYSEDQLKRMVIQELRYTYQRCFDQVPHPRNPTVLLGSFEIVFWLFSLNPPPLTLHTVSSKL